MIKSKSPSPETNESLHLSAIPKDYQLPKGHFLKICVSPKAVLAPASTPKKIGERWNLTNIDISEIWVIAHCSLSQCIDSMSSFNGLTQWIYSLESLNGFTQWIQTMDWFDGFIQWNRLTDSSIDRFLYLISQLKKVGYWIMTQLVDQAID